MTVQGAPAEADCDVLIAGGGMVGASLAVALAGLPLRVTLVEAVPAGVPGQPSFDARTTALSRSSQHILATLGIWAPVRADATPIRRIHVSERGRLGTTVIDGRDEGGEPLGYVVENRLLGAALWRAMGGSPNVRLRSPATVAGVAATEDTLAVTVQEGGPPRCSARACWWWPMVPARDCGRHWVSRRGFVPTSRLRLLATSR